VIDMRMTASASVLLLLGCAACGSSAGASDSARVVPAERAVASAPVAPRSGPPKLAIGPDADKSDVSSIAGKTAPAWELPTWFNSKPLHTTDLKGRVVLVRWFMSSECQYCSATAPSLVALHDAYEPEGLTIVGMYHHKSESPLVVENVRELVQDHYGFKFPIAIDDDWKTLKRWWLDAHPESWTSVSFLVDRKGVVRFVHLGGEYPPESADYRQMRTWIDELVAEPAAPG
jgi:peroxiredoxin